MKKLLLAALTLVVVGSTQISAKNFPPRFTKDGTIEMVTKGGSCGGVTITPKEGVVNQLKVESYKVSYPLGAGEKREKIGETTLDDLGNRFRYDWAGIGAKSHYRLVVKEGIRAGGGDINWTRVNAQDKVTLENIRHNKACLIGPAGPQAKYGALNMNKG